MLAPTPRLEEMIADSRIQAYCKNLYVNDLENPIDRKSAKRRS